MSQAKLWPMDEHTEGKHLILKEYLNGWLPILGSRNPRIVFIDGFAGPGEYQNGQIGSPIVAIDCVEQHKRSGGVGGTEVVSIFIEERQDRADHLRELLATRPSVAGITTSVLHGKFEDHMAEMLDYIREQNRKMAPAFVMIDPFGVKGNPMSLVERVLSNPKSECFISFMYEPVRRWINSPEFEPHLTALFGSDEWKECLTIDDAEDKSRFLHSLYKSCLKRHGAKFVIHFGLWKGNRHIYSIFFASGHEKGCNLMKEAIWKIVQNGSFDFRGHSQSQMVLFKPDVDTSALANQLREKFGNKSTRIEEIDSFVKSDETIFHIGHLRKKTLQPLEKAEKIIVHRPPGVRKPYFPSGRGITIEFL